MTSTATPWPCWRWRPRRPWAALSRAQIAAALRRGGRQRRVEERTAAIQASLRSAQLAAPDVVSAAMGSSVAALVAVIGELNTQIGRLEAELSDRFEQHPDTKVIRSLPGLGMVLGARVLGEFGDDPNRYCDAKSRKNYAGTSPIIKASGKHRVVLARYARNRRLADACYLWAFASLTASPGARVFYDQRRAAGDTHHRALRARWPTGSSASSTAASFTASSTTRTSPGGTASNGPLDKNGPLDV